MVILKSFQACLPFTASLILLPDGQTLGTFFGPITPYSGNGQMGFATYHTSLPNFRECIAAPLISQMITGQQYQVLFFLTNGNNNGYQLKTNNIGICFSTIPLFQAIDQPIAAFPQIEITTIVSNVNSWQSYTYVFTADSAYNYITIGNFRNDLNTIVSGSGIGAYYFIDKISVTPVNPLGIDLTRFEGFIDGKKIKLEWTTISETGNDYFDVERSSTLKNFETIGRIEGAGYSSTIINYSFYDTAPLTGTNYYRIKQTDFNSNNSFSTIIAVNNNSGKPGNLVISPNPATDFIYVTFPRLDENYEINILNTFGCSLIRSENVQLIDVSALQSGIFCLEAKSSAGIFYSSKFVRE